MAIPPSANKSMEAKMTQKHETILGMVMMIGAVLGGLALAALIMGLPPVASV
jgi:hypothetical protein